MIVSALRFPPPMPPLAAVAASGPVVRELLESTPVPQHSAFRLVDSSEGSLAYKPGFRSPLQGVTLIGIRHGETEANASPTPVVCGQAETPLTANGRAQARAAAEKLFQQFGGLQPPPILYSGPLSRATETAQAFVDLVRQRTGVELPIERDPRLTEMGFGRYELASVGAVRKELPQLCQRWDSRHGSGLDFTHRFPGGESRLDVMLRVQDWMQEASERYPGRTILMFCHQETLVAASTLLGNAPVREGRIRADSQRFKNADPVRLS